MDREQITLRLPAEQEGSQYNQLYIQRYASEAIL